jgi:hypothetical protein
MLSYALTYIKPDSWHGLFFSITALTELMAKSAFHLLLLHQAWHCMFTSLPEERWKSSSQQQPAQEITAKNWNEKSEIASRSLGWSSEKKPLCSH